MPAGDPMTLLWHVTLAMEHHGQICQNGFYFSNRGGLSVNPNILGPYTQGICQVFDQYVMPSIRLFHNQEVRYKSLVCSTLIPHDGPIGELLYETGEGAQGDESLPSYCSAILTLRSGFGGRSNRGRLYFGGISENFAAGGKLLQDSFTALQDIGDNLLGAFGPTGIEGVLRYVIYSKKLGYSTEAGFQPEGIIPITHTIARRNLGTQRHRMLGKGN
jgi:hypothetical protein